MGLLLAIEIVAKKLAKEMFNNKFEAVYRLAEIEWKTAFFYTRKPQMGLRRMAHDYT